MIGLSSIVFEVRDMVTIILGVSSLVGLYYALKTSIEKVSSTVSELEKKQKQDTNTIMDAIKDSKEDLEKREALIYSRINEVREDQKRTHEKLDAKIDVLCSLITATNASLYELNGYIKGKEKT